MTTLLQQAISSLNIHDVYLTHSQSSIEDGSSAKYDDFSSFRTQVKEDSPVYDIVEFNDDKKILRIKCGYGLRWVSEEEEQELVQRAVIEASFVAEYAMLSQLDDSAITEFVKRNVHHHVWPYWREFLASTTERMRLPRVVAQMIQFGSAISENLTEE